MSRGSLRLRLLLAGFCAVALALVIAWVALTSVFARHLERRAIAEAEAHLHTLIAGAVVDNDTLTLTTQPGDPAFGAAYGGLYWQVQRSDGVVARSRSLWDTELQLPRDDLSDAGVHVHSLSGPRGAALLAVERPLLLQSTNGVKRYRITVAQDRRGLEMASRDFARDLAVGLGVLALALLAASFVQVGIGLRPLAAIRGHMQAIRSGGERRLPDTFPLEVTPLATEINALLDERDRSIERARGRAADLAHGLKTPLTALAANVRLLHAAGHTDIAREIGDLGSLMERHVHRELARARIASPAVRREGVDLRPVADLVAAAVARTPEAAGKSFDFDIAPGLKLPVDRADLEEMLGNLVENAARHARSTVRIAAAASPLVTLEVADDGPGIAKADRERLAARGNRLDQSEHGAGLGLAIVADIADAYGASLTLGGADLGGLSITITFPSS